MNFLPVLKGNEDRELRRGFTEVDSSDFTVATGLVCFASLRRWEPGRATALALDAFVRRRGREQRLLNRAHTAVEHIQVIIVEICFVALLYVVHTQPKCICTTPVSWRSGTVLDFCGCPAKERWPEATFGGRVV